jgi:chromosomal replication initiator protein
MDRTNGTRTTSPDDLLPFEPAWPFEPLAPPPRDTAAPLPTPQRLLGQIAATFDVSVADLTGPSRRSYVSATRQAAAYVLHMRVATLSLHDIGTLLGGRDSSTIGQAIRRARERMAQDAGYAAQIRALLGTRSDRNR